MTHHFHSVLLLIYLPNVYSTENSLKLKGLSWWSVSIRTPLQHLPQIFPTGVLSLSDILNKKQISEKEKRGLDRQTPFQLPYKSSGTHIGWIPVPVKLWHSTHQYFHFVKQLKWLFCSFQASTPSNFLLCKVWNHLVVTSLPFLVLLLKTKGPTLKSAFPF